MEAVAYAARDENAEDLGGSIFVNDEKTIDVAQELDEGEGVIVVAAGSPEARALGGFPALEQVSVPEGRELAGDEQEPAGPNATDAALELAAEKGVDLGQVKGTGADGRITVDDVRAAEPTADDGEED